ncbi:lytic murein transglycosylase B, partial [Acinetobacter baumannii]|nr:lytic murein transglycosylase B [Acinetobacter baumannii]
MKFIVSALSAIALFAGAHGDAFAAGQSTQSQAQVAAAAELDPEHVNFLEWLPVREFIEEMVANHGFEREALQALFK